ncbi:MAG TPA: DUF309 domain-containing protein [Thermoplasmata archaeon]|nr:DUF309 domain-containing protein [Thermoplasmata archaeon]
MDAAGTPDEADRIRDGLRLFNEEFFFEAHEVLEDVWHKEHGEPRLFLQGLIQLCAGFHHFQNGNYGGAAALLARGIEKMRRYPERYLGLDAAAILTRVDACRERIERMRTGTEPAAPLEFPKIRLEG